MATAIILQIPQKARHTCIAERLLVPEEDCSVDLVRKIMCTDFLAATSAFSIKQ